MSRRLLAVTLLLIACFAAALLSGCETAQPTPSASVDDDWLAQQAAYVSVTGKVKPAQYASLSFGSSGVVARVSVQEGDTVIEGQELARLDAPELLAAYDQAQGALEAAQGQLALLLAGARDEDVDRIKAARYVAHANIDLAKSAREANDAAVAQAEAAVSEAQAALALLRAGATAEEIEIARQQVEQAKAVRYGLQGQRDLLNGQKNSPFYQDGSFEAAEGQVFAADNTVKIAELSYDLLVDGARVEELAMAQAGVEQAQAAVDAASANETAIQAQIDVAMAQVVQADTELAAIQAPARHQELAIAAARVAQAEAAVLQAEAMVNKTILTAPFAGTVTQLDLRPGEWAMPGRTAASIGDLSGYVIETTDLDEIDVSRVVPGATVEITFDALPGVELAGTVESVAEQSSAGAGGTTYKTVIVFDPGDLHLRWGMTAFCDIDSE